MDEKATRPVLLSPLSRIRCCWVFILKKAPNSDHNLTVLLIMVGVLHIWLEMLYQRNKEFG